jgi:hypothetical protein
MSAMNLPGPMPYSNPPPGAPGQPNVASDPGAEGLSLDRRMGEAFMTIGQELLKPLQARDPLALLKGKSMLMQVQAQKPMAMQPQTSGVTMTPQTGIPRPVSGTTDALTGMAVPKGPSYGP